MKIWAYADCHIGTPETLRELEINPDFSKCLRFIQIYKEEKPDMVLSLGDFSEQIWDGTKGLEKMFPFIAEMRGVTTRFLNGNHDPIGEDIIEIEGIQFLHGHQWERASDGFVERLHQKANSQSKYTIIAHTHQPELGTNFMDVGSLTITGTFGEIDNNTKRIRTL